MSWLRLTLPPIAALIVFAPVLAFGFLEWDDRAYVLDNPVIQDFGADRIGLLLSPRTRTLSAWTPTTLATYGVELSVLGADPFGFHATNLLLHALNSLLVALLLIRLGLGTTGAAIAGMLFAVHPLQVEAVAWARRSAHPTLIGRPILRNFMTLSPMRFSPGMRVRPHP